MLTDNVTPPRVPCPECGESDAVEIGQSYYQDKLRWYESVNCPACGLRREVDGTGLAPSEIRNYLLAKEGKWEISILNFKSLPAVAKVLREALGLHTKDALALAKRDPIFSGTKAEIAWLQDLLVRAGEAPLVKQQA